MVKKTDASVSDAVPLTLDQIDAELERLASERTSLLDAQAALPANEKRLLERGAPDAEFTALDIRRRKLAHSLDELDRREAELLRSVPAAQRDERHREWLAFVDKFEALAQRAHRVANELAEVQRDIHGLHLAACRAGFNRYESTQATLPTIAGARVPWDAFFCLPGLVPSLRRAVSSPVEAIKLWPVRFARFSVVVVGLAQIGYNLGEVAGFDPATAWLLVETERAKWADPRQIPPKPPVKRKRSK